MLERRIAVAPMLSYTDRHFRYLVRLFAPKILLYTEMITCGAIKYSKNLNQLLAYHEIEHPIAIQLGGSNPAELSWCARLAENYGYDEINLNLGCPSNRVQAGKFGASLMLEPYLVAECLARMQHAVNIPVSVKCRLGVDDCDSYEYVKKFVQILAQTGCIIFIIHARKAWLKGLSPKANRTIPPLRYDLAQQLKHDFPQLKIILNGGITALQTIEQHLTTFDGVMIGREAYKNSYLLAQIAEKYYSQPLLSRAEILTAFLPYLHEQAKQHVPLRPIMRHLCGLWHGQPQAKAIRTQLLSAGVCAKDILLHLRKIITPI